MRTPFSSSPYKYAAFAVLLLSGIFIGWKEYNDPYKDSWFYRTFIEGGFNAEITVNVTFDGKPQTLHRIVRCRRMVSRAELFHTEYGYGPNFFAFADRTPTGEAIIVTTPAVCGLRHWAHDATSLDDWTMPVPEGHIPYMAVANKADDPDEIIAYASRQAYKGENARLQYKSMTIAPPKTFWAKTRFGYDPVDAYPYLNATSMQILRYQTPEYSLHYKSPVAVWHYFSFVKISEDLWSQFRYEHFEEKSWIDDLNKDKSLKFLGSRETEILQCKVGIKQTPCYSAEKDMDGGLPYYGYGIFPGPLLDGKTSDRINRTKYYDEMVPYRFAQDAWRPDLSNRGRYIFFKSDEINNHTYLVEHGKLMTNLPRIRRAMGRNVLFGDRIEQYEYYEFYYTASRPFDTFHTVYIPSERSFYVPMTF